MADRLVVADASPLIGLAIAGQFHLLRALFGQIRVPGAQRRGRAMSERINAVAASGFMLALFVVMLLASASDAAAQSRPVRIMFLHDEGARAGYQYLNAVVQRMETHYTLSGISVDFVIAGEVESNVRWRCEDAYGTRYPVVNVTPGEVLAFGDRWPGADLYYFTLSLPRFRGHDIL